MNLGKKARVFWILFFLVFCSGCSPILKNEQTVTSQVVSILPGSAVGQSFVAGEQGLTGIDVFVAPDAGGAVLALSLYPDSRREQRIATSKLMLEAAEGQGYQRFSFPTLKNSARADYYFEIQVEDGQGAKLFASPGETYLNGALYLDQSAQDLQLAFRLAYDRVEFAKGLFSEILGWVWYLVLGGWLFILPGWAILQLLLGEAWSKRDWTEKTALAAGAGVALFPVLLLWSKLLHLRLGSATIWVFPAAAAAYLAWKNRKWLSPRAQTRRRWNSGNLAVNFTFLAVVALIFFSRFWAIRAVDVPLWGDSYQHTMIAQLIAENQGLFDSWHPYEPYRSLTVQYSFSANTAAWMWLTGMGSPQAVLVFGQLLNFFAILAITPLAVQLAKGNRWVGVASLVLAGLFSSMPAFYVNWGRYAQLTGQTILPVGLCLLWYWLEEPRMLLRQLVLHGLILAGLLLSYYRMAFYYAAFIPVLLLLLWINAPRGRGFRSWTTILIKLISVGVIALVFISPWVLNVAGSKLSDTVETGITTEAPLQGVLADYRAWTNYQSYTSIPLLALSIASLLLSLVLKRFEVFGLVLWLGLVSAVKAGSLVNLPGANLMQSSMVLMSLYIFVSIAGAWILGWVFEQGTRRFGLVGKTVVVIFLLGLSLYGFNTQRKILNPHVYSIVTRPDLRAMQWIRSNIPQDAVFLVEGFRIYNGASAVGSDGGWWIPLLTKRMNTMPPQYALLNEQSEPDDYSKKVVELVASLENHSLSDPAVRDDLCQRGITHIYVGQQQGKASMEKTQLFPADLGEIDGVLHPIYAEDRVRIYVFSAGFCTGTSSD